VRVEVVAVGVGADEIVAHMTGVGVALGEPFLR
jgi:hypothetical protein